MFAVCAVLKILTCPSFQIFCVSYSPYTYPKQSVRFLQYTASTFLEIQKSYVILCS